MLKSARRWQTHRFPHVITPAVIKRLQRVRVKARSTETMEMNGHVNREVDWGAEAPLVAWSAIFSLPFLSSEDQAQSYLSCSEISNRAAIHHWLTCYWSPVHPLFSTKLYYEKRITNVCTVWAAHTFACLSKRLRKRERGKKSAKTFFRVTLVRRVKQFYSERLEMLFWRWQVWNGFETGEFQLATLVIHQWHLSDKCCVLFPCPKQYTEWNMLIQASTCKCFRGEVHALSSCTEILHNILDLNINFQF